MYTINAYMPLPFNNKKKETEREAEHDCRYSMLCIDRVEKPAYGQKYWQQSIYDDA